MTRQSESETADTSDAKQFLNEIIAHFATSKEGPGEDWAHDDAFTSYCLDHRAKDGTRFWIDLEDDGTISILWKPAGQEKPIIKRFVTPSQPAASGGVNLPFERLPQHAGDPGFGPVPNVVPLGSDDPNHPSNIAAPAVTLTVSKDVEKTDGGAK